MPMNDALQIDAEANESAERRLIERARRAAELLEDPILREAFDTIRARFTEQLFATAVRDVEGRERLWLMCKCLESVEGHVKAMVQTGQMAKQEAERRRSLVQRMKDWATE